jgi:hypothetical protein
MKYFGQYKLFLKWKKLSLRNLEEGKPFFRMPECFPLPSEKIVTKSFKLISQEAKIVTKSTKELSGSVGACRQSEIATKLRNSH